MLTYNHFFKFIFILWLPLSIGNLDFLSTYSSSLQSILVFLLYLNMLLFFQLKDFLNAKLIYKLWIVLLVISSFSYVGLYGFSKGIGFFLSFVWVCVIYSRLGLDGTLELLKDGINFWLVMSIVYVVVFFDNSFSYVNDINSLDSFYSHKNTYGRFLFLTLLFNVIALYKNNRMSLMYRTKVCVFYLCLFTLMVMTHSKTNIILAIVTLIYFSVCSIFSEYKDKLRIVINMGLVFIVAVFPLLFVFGLISIENIGSSLDYISISGQFDIPTTGRLTIWSQVINDVFFDDVYILGYGVGYYFSELSYFYLDGIGLGEFIPRDPHNGYVDLFSSLGLVGVFVFAFCVLYSVFKLNFTCFRIYSILIFLVLLYLIANFSESYITKTTNVYNFILYLIFIVCGFITKADRHEP